MTFKIQDKADFCSSVIFWIINFARDIPICNFIKFKSITTLNTVFLNMMGCNLKQHKSAQPESLCHSTPQQPVMPWRSYLEQSLGSYTIKQILYLFERASNKYKKGTPLAVQESCRGYTQTGRHSQVILGRCKFSLFA